MAEKTSTKSSLAAASVNINVLRQEILKKYRSSKHGRVILAKRQEWYSLSNLNAIQLDSYAEFLQEDVATKKRRAVGLQFLFRSIFPFTSADGKVRLEFQEYTFGKKKYTIDECLSRDMTYVVPLRAVISMVLEEKEEIKEQEIYICDLPYMTENGTFVINGAERVVVSQIHRSPGVIFDYNARANMFHSRLIPNRGPWVEFEIVKDMLYVRVDRKARILGSVFFRVLGDDYTEKDYKEKILKVFMKTEIKNLRSIKSKDKIKASLIHRYMAQSLYEEGQGKPLIAAGDKIVPEIVEDLLQLNLKEIELVHEDDVEANEVILNTLQKDDGLLTRTRKEACSYIYYTVRGAEPASSKAAYNEIVCRWQCDDCKAEVAVFKKPTKCPNESCPSRKAKAKACFTQCDKSMFFNNNHYSLGEVGRYKINKKFDYEESLDQTVLTPRDIYSTVKYLLRIYRREISLDDIDHLGNRRIRCIGEQLTNHLKISFLRMERLAKERITLQDHDTLTPQNLISIKPITAGVKEFFGTAQLSQFMDQTNPLAALTHKRRLNALGPWGAHTRESWL